MAINVTHSETKYKWILGNAGMRRSVTAYDSEQREEENRMSEQKNKKVKLNTNSTKSSSLSSCSQMSPPDGSRACTWLDILGESDYLLLVNKVNDR